jgi:hypothetical protein
MASQTCLPSIPDDLPEEPNLSRRNSSRRKWFKAEHQPILDRTTFDRVQDQLKSNTIDRPKDQSANDAPLTGKLFDDRGNRMGPKPSPEKRRPIPLLLQHGVAGPERFTLNPPPQMPGSNTFLPGHRSSVRIALV